MNIKKCFILAAIVFYITCGLNAEFNIGDIEYLVGNDFLQLHFKGNDLVTIPDIPDIYYPDNTNPLLLAMRIKDIPVNLPSPVYTFDSPLLQKVEVKNEKTHTDFFIHLKQPANYKISSNTKGIFIEFPVTERISESNANKSIVENSNQTIEPVPQNIIVTESEKVQEMNGIKLLTATDDSVTFGIDLTGKVNYSIIPIEKSPYRLAIDLYNTRSEKIKQFFNKLNVIGVRGSYNAPNVYRIVFDLEYLKDYSIAYNDDSMLEIKFANKNKTNPQNEMLLGYNKTENPSIKADADKNNSIVEKNKNLSNSVENEKLQISEITEPATKKETIETPLTTISNNAVEAPQNKQGYFSEEKSQVTEQDLNQSYISYEDEEGNEKKAFIAKTIQSGEKQYSGELLTFEFYEIELRDIILAIAEISGLNIIMDPGISGKVTCRLHDVPWDQALEYFLKIHDLDMVQEGRLVRIGKVDKLAQEASKRKLMKEAIDMQTAREVITHPLSYAKVGEVSGLLKKHLSSRGEIQTDNRTNTLIITDIPESIQIIKKLIADLDTPVRQVSIEARIVETNTNFVRSLGIQWGYGMAMSSMYGNQTSLKFPNSINMYGNQLSSTTSPFTGPLGGYAVNLPASGSTTGMAFSLANVANTFRLDVALSAMQNQGKGRIISAPKTTTQNNMEASIMQGKQIPVQVNQNNTITVQYRPAALELKVTPQITAENTIICTIDIKNNAPDFANLVMGIPPITTQTIKTTVLIDNGGTVVIGGMYRIEDQTSQASTPFLSKIPILGNLFKDSNVRNEKKELLVFITPRIIK